MSKKKSEPPRKDTGVLRHSIIPDDPDHRQRQLTRAAPVKTPRGGRCSVCGCRVYKTETICGECICEEDGL